MNPPYAPVAEPSLVHLGIVTPMANEGEDATRFVADVLAQCARVGAVSLFAVLDTATTDHSRELLEAYACAEPRLRVIWAPENRCVVDAYVRGYREALQAGCDWILEIDAGFSHQPEEVPQFIEAMAAGHDCVFGSRFMRGGRMSECSLKRYLISRGGTVIINALLGTRQTDMASGFEMFTRAALERVLARGIRSRAHFFQTEIKVACRDMRWVEVPIHYRSPSPRLKNAAVVEAFRQLWRLRAEMRARS